MRPVTINPQDPPSALTEIQTASHENDLMEIALNFSAGNAPLAQRAFNGASVQLSATGVGNGADTTEDTLFTYTLPANSLSLVNQGLSILAAGTLANNADNKTVKLYFGTQSYSLGTVATANVAWSVKMTVFKTASNAQLILCEGMIGSTAIALSLLTGTQTDTSSIVIKVTGQAGTANANDIVGKILAVNGALSDVSNALATWFSDCQKGGLYRTT